MITRPLWGIHYCGRMGSLTHGSPSGPFGGLAGPRQTPCVPSSGRRRTPFGALAGPRRTPFGALASPRQGAPTTDTLAKKTGVLLKSPFLGLGMEGGGGWVDCSISRYPDGAKNPCLFSAGIHVLLEQNPVFLAQGFIPNWGQHTWTRKRWNPEELHLQTLHFPQVL